MRKNFELIKFVGEDGRGSYHEFVPRHWVIGFSMDEDKAILVGGHESTMIYGKMSEQEIQDIFYQIDVQIWEDCDPPYGRDEVEYVYEIMRHFMESAMLNHLQSDTFSDRIEHSNWSYKQLAEEEFERKSSNLQSVYDTVENLKF